MTIRRKISLKFIFLTTAAVAVITSIISDAYHDSLAVKAASDIVVLLKGSYTSTRPGLLFEGSIEEVNLARGAFATHLAEPNHWSLMRRFDIPAGLAVTDSHIDIIARARTIKSLNLRGACITDKSLARIATLNELSILDLSATPISNIGLTHLAALAHLRELNVSACGITDKGLTSIVHLKSLRVLKLDHCPISDKGAHTIGQMHYLSHLYLRDTMVTSQGLSIIRRLLPKTEVVIDRTTYDGYLL